MGTSMETQKTENWSIMWFSHPNVEYIFKWNKVWVWETTWNPYIYSSTIDIREDMGPTQTHTNRGMNKKKLLYIYSMEYDLAIKNEILTFITKWIPNNCNDQGWARPNPRIPSGSFTWMAKRQRFEPSSVALSKPLASSWIASGAANTQTCQYRMPVIPQGQCPEMHT